MLLVVDAVIDGILCQSMMRQVNDEEVAFEALNELVSQGFQLQRAILREDNHQLSVPVEAFDGQLVEGHFRSLQEQWKEMLKPLSREDTSESYSTYVQLNDHYGTLLTHLEQMIFQLEARRNRVQFIRTVEVRNRLLHQINALLEINQRLYQQTLESYRRNKERIVRLYGDESTS